ncbi:MAG: fibronectin type III domain-containing protein, partial [Taibaiella sp.]|nr:fibronectin type III domain-containing protein [Taibaiella sp.]
MNRIFILVALSLFSKYSAAQTCEDYAVQLTATTQLSPPKITLNWKPLSGAVNYRIYKKAKAATVWGSVLATLGATDSMYADTAVVVDSAYEYGVEGTTSTLYPRGYIYAGIKNPATHSRGILILMVDSTYTDSCSADIHRLMKDISADGWEIIRHDVARTLKDTGVKTLIRNDYNSHTNVKAVLLLGHVAVPYSGDLNPDAHPDHLGAWPADIYYSQIAAAWTDASVNDTVSPYPFTRNVPGDGKWDQVGWYSTPEIQVSRIDVYDMPAFSPSEIQLMKSYLAKDHSYKMDSLAVRHRALISDNFGVFSGSNEAFASCGWRNFPPLVGRDSFGALPFISSLNTGSYQWAYGCGGGSFSSAGGIGTTADFASNNVNGIFTMLFGSYFGDWNVQNNFLRAPLCANVPALTSCWAGRPYWYFHHMALGENIGYSAWITQKNDGYFYGTPSYGTQMVHIALMGDLTLRTDYIKPARNLAITKTAKHGAMLSWSASGDGGVIGYYVYRATSEFGNYQRISGMTAGTTFSDTVGTDG